MDLSDFALLQKCLTGNATSQTLAECQPARLDADNDVDSDDVALLLACLAGADIPVTDPACAD